MTSRSLVLTLGSALAALALTNTALFAQGLATERVVTGLERPVFLCSPPGDPQNRLFVLEQYLGRIRVVKDGVLLETPFLELDVATENELGLLGMAFHPDYAQNGRFYVSYTTVFWLQVVDEFTVSADPDVANPASTARLLSQQQFQNNHQGGCLQFGDDGMLYFATGDGGSANDPFNLSQNLGQPQGKMHRFDVDNAPTYVPADNPYLGPPNDPDGSVIDTIWSRGLRNPWRFSFDSLTGDLYIGDVGQELEEEIDIRPASSTGTENYGWRCIEATTCTGNSGCECADTELVDPVHTYLHESGRCAIIGGCVYRGQALPEIDGAYFFADYCTGEIWTFEWDGAAMQDFQERTDELRPDVGALSKISSFGVDAEGELYMTDLISGEVHKVVSQCGTVPDCVTAFCDASDGALASCPCSNPGDPDTGCDNPAATGGVGLAVTAIDHVAQLATLVATGYPTAETPTAVVIRATNREPSPVVFFDGVRCVGLDGFTRLEAGAASVGTSTHFLDHGAGSGTYHYQVWYRSAPDTFCDPTAIANTSSGRSIVW